MSIQAFNAHVQMMRRLREKFNEDPSQRSWLSRIVSRDYDNRNINLRSKYYNIEELINKGYSARDFILERISWTSMRRLGYNLEEALKLGFTDDDLVACAITNEDLLKDRHFIVAAKRKNLVSCVCSTREDMNQWMPSELFRLGFSRQELVDEFNFSLADIQCDGFKQYYNVTGKPLSIGAPVRIAGPSTADAVPNLKINMKNFM